MSGGVAYLEGGDYQIAKNWVARPATSQRFQSLRFQGACGVVSGGMRWAEAL